MPHFQNKSVALKITRVWILLTRILFHVFVFKYLYALWTEIMLDVAIIAEAAYFKSSVLKFSLLMVNVVAINMFCEQVYSIVRNLMRVHFENILH